MPKTHTSIDLKPEGDISVSLDFENVDEYDDLSIEVAKVGDMVVTFKPGAIDRKQEALETASLITAIDGPDDQAMAIESVSILKAFTQGVERSREEVKRPFWNAGKAIDEIAKKESKAALEEIARVEKLLAGYQREQDRIANEAREAAEAIERKRIADENAKLAEEQRLRDESARLAREALEAAQRKGKQAQRDAELARMQAENAKAQADLIAANRRADENAAKFTPSTTAPAEWTKPIGTINRKGWDVEVTNWTEFHRAFGFRFIKCELDLQAFKYYLDGEGVDHTKIPGVKVTPKTTVNVRAAK